MLQNPCKTLGFKKNMVYKIPPGGGGKPYPASGLIGFNLQKDIVLASNADPDEMPHNTAFHLGLHCLSKYGFLVYKGLKYKEMWVFSFSEQQKMPFIGI